MSETNVVAPKPRRAIRYTDLVIGLVPIFSAAALVGALVFQSTRPLRAHYEQRAKALLNEQRLAEAQACLKRLLNLEPNRQEIRYTLGQTYFAQGQAALAEEIIRSLLPPGEKGYLPARFWLAERSTALAPYSQERAKEAEQLLVGLLKEFPKEKILKRMTGLLFAQTNQPKPAIPLLLDVANGDPPVLLAAARCYQATGDPAGAARYRREAITAAKAIVEKEPKSAAGWLYWAQSLAALKDFAGAEKILDQAEAATKPGAFDIAKGALFAEWSSFVVADKERPLKDRLLECFKLVARGLAYDPANELLSAELQSMTMLKGPDGEELLAKVEALTKKDSTPESKKVTAAAYQALGNLKMVRGQKEEARKLWETGHALEPGLPVLANNLAWATAFVEPSDPDRALELVQATLKDRPNDARIHGTHGLILRKLGRKKEALEELKLSAMAGNAHPEVRAALADLLGLPQSKLQPEPPTAPEKPAETFSAPTPEVKPQAAPAGKP